MNSKYTVQGQYTYINSKYTVHGQYTYINSKYTVHGQYTYNNSKYTVHGQYTYNNSKYTVHRLYIYNVHKWYRNVFRAKKKIAPMHGITASSLMIFRRKVQSLQIILMIYYVNFEDKSKNVNVCFSIFIFLRIC